jgi:hypothetical protein
MRALDLAGKKFGRLTLIEVIGVTSGKQRLWLCICDCGNEHKAGQGHLSKGKVTSCGCWRKERATKHGMHGTPEWFAYNHAQQRCKPTHPAHQHYFDRGIFFKFTALQDFLNEVGLRPSSKHSLDRIDNDKGYEPGNLRWATRKEQMRNTRCNNCLLLKARIKELEHH